nr:indole-3-glycerol phosphate synthase TrpC [Lentilactobacillus rapi]
MILDDLVTATKARLAQHEAQLPLNQLKQQVAQLPASSKPDFLSILKQPGLHVISEVKKSSPSKERSLLTFHTCKLPSLRCCWGRRHFGVNRTRLFQWAAQLPERDQPMAVSAPTLRKDFTIDPYMIYEAKANGASIILLIVAIVDDQQLKEYRKLAESLGMQAIVEAYTADEVTRALKSGAKIVGINNRNLKDFHVDFNNSLKLKAMVPESIPVIAESGIKTQADVAQLAAAGFNGILMGETLMRSANKQALIKSFKEA